MKGYSSDKVRNVVLLGHGGCGKTTLIEAALLATGVTSRLGRVEDGNTVSEASAIASSITPFILSSNSPLNFVPATSDDKST